jgi:hypothetical protein
VILADMSAYLMFPDLDVAKKWYFAPEYQEILHLRTDSTISDLILVDPVAADFTSKAWAGQIRELLTPGPTAPE